MSLSTDQRSQSAGEAELKELLKVIEQKQRFQVRFCVCANYDCQLPIN